MSLTNYMLNYAKLKLEHAISSVAVHLHMCERKRATDLTIILASQSEVRKIFISAPRSAKE